MKVKVEQDHFMQTKEAEREKLKKECIAFFYWWYNQDGTNTEQGFDKWYGEVRNQLKDNK